jgi:DNA mismatch repair ATPase MutL
MEEDFEEYNVLEEELVTVKSQKSGQGKFLSSDGHTFRVEHDAAKKYVNFLFNEEVQEPITNEIERRVTKAAKRARQRSLMEEELNEFYMPQSMKPTTFQSTDTNIYKVERDGASKQDNIFKVERDVQASRTTSRSGERSQSTRRQQRELGGDQPREPHQLCKLTRSLPPSLLIKRKNVLMRIQVTPKMRNMHKKLQNLLRKLPRK